MAGGLLLATGASSAEPQAEASALRQRLNAFHPLTAAQLRRLPPLPKAGSARALSAADAELVRSFLVTFQAQSVELGYTAPDPALHPPSRDCEWLYVAECSPRSAAAAARRGAPPPRPPTALPVRGVQHISSDLGPGRGVLETFSVGSRPRFVLCRLARPGPAPVAPPPPHAAAPQGFNTPAHYSPRSLDRRHLSPPQRDSRFAQLLQGPPPPPQPRMQSPPRAAGAALGGSQPPAPRSLFTALAAQQAAAAPPLPSSGGLRPSLWTRAAAEASSVPLSPPQLGWPSGSRGPQPQYHTDALGFLGARGTPSRPDAYRSPNLGTPPRRLAVAGILHQRALAGLSVSPPLSHGHAPPPLPPPASPVGDAQAEPPIELSGSPEEDRAAVRIQAQFRGMRTRREHSPSPPQDAPAPAAADRAAEGPARKPRAGEQRRGPFRPSGKARIPAPADRPPGAAPLRRPRRQEPTGSAPPKPPPPPPQQQQQQQRGRVKQPKGRKGSAAEEQRAATLQPSGSRKTVGFSATTDQMCVLREAETAVERGDSDASGMLLAAAGTVDPNSIVAATIPMDSSAPHLACPIDLDGTPEEDQAAVKIQARFRGLQARRSASQSPPKGQAAPEAG
eukprot:TRINITY_DN9910_c0_g1_i2.p1 TRINITY_DN9910_c0_g1~~TRINITY_DN9910_c0_g1_i2.p1  ORF type:complete len:645 (+),score=174.03 TRINITY_DN9910_c0_g1_i2:79-1935(+)